MSSEALADSEAPEAAARSHRVVCRLDDVLRDRAMTLTDLSERTGITMANLSILKNNKAKAIRFSTLTAICDAAGTTPGELFTLADVD